MDREVEGLVPRHKKIKVRAHLYNPETDEIKQVEIRISGFVSIVLQHEIDHLNGVLFVDIVKDSLEDAEPVLFLGEEIESEEE